MTSVRSRLDSVRARVASLIDARPLFAFFLLLGLLLGLVVLGSYLRRPNTSETAAEPEPTLVETYAFGQSPKVTLAARIEKSGVISVYAQSAGIVQKINVTEGKHVGRGTSLVSLSTTYQGGNAASLSRQIAQKNFETTKENFDTQKDIISKQKELAEKGNIQAEQLRELTRQSLEDTRSLVRLNEEIVGGIDEQIKILESLNVNGASNSAILSAKQGKAAAQGGLSSLRSTLRTLEYQSDEEKTPAQIADLSKDVTIKQLELQERSLVLARDIAELNYKLARVSESLMYPATPCAGVVERIHVKVGQSVAPGTLIATIKADQGENTAVVLVSRDLAKQVSKAETSDFIIGGKKVSLYPRYVATEATDGTLYSIVYSIPATYGSNLTNGSSIMVSIPLGTKQIATSELFIPLDSVYQTQETSYVYVTTRMEESDQLVAKTKEVTLGDVSGEYVRVIGGVSASDTIIVSRSVQDGERVRTE